MILLFLLLINELSFLVGNKNTLPTLHGLIGAGNKNTLPTLHLIGAGNKNTLPTLHLIGAGNKNTLPTISRKSHVNKISI
ncbi:MAG: hypothetical protein DRR16_09860 [Candidatus Parabeggiatoa sp. nov. 3]|nr:MAG: hypothetical protein DRR00_15090 [Gammaproteobacteria bacterium]RKZ86384.1 MAG: hypothetical protein DRR16_09860 [Gammaproteobacteria bacterium]